MSVNETTQKTKQTKFCLSKQELKTINFLFFSVSPSSMFSLTSYTSFSGPAHDCDLWNEWSSTVWFEKQFFIRSLEHVGPEISW